MRESNDCYLIAVVYWFREVYSSQNSNSIFVFLLSRKSGKERKGRHFGFRSGSVRPSSGTGTSKPLSDCNSCQPDPAPGSSHHAGNNLL